MVDQHVARREYVDHCSVGQPRSIRACDETDMAT
jgi:hypothetical protein